MYRLAPTMTASQSFGRKVGEYGCRVISTVQAYKTPVVAFDAVPVGMEIPVDGFWIRKGRFFGKVGSEEMGEAVVEEINVVG